MRFKDEKTRATALVAEVQAAISAIKQMSGKKGADRVTCQQLRRRADELLSHAKVMLFVAELRAVQRDNAILQAQLRRSAPPRNAQAHRSP